ncbi:hypothetical protein RRG08_012759 [Elysia crispata]|uniref:Uncharacterized protein n=1 Tax=Elysia crispata TaxID=231223 RepID=A0AAE1D3C6_9GAST|nr:hypothetical protein RRG08_012759 [Elysia crispata]
MVKPRKDRQRKRKFYGNRFTPSKTNDEKRSRSDDNGLQNGSGSEHCQQTQASSSSFRKLSLDLGERPHRALDLDPFAMMPSQMKS